MRPRGRNKLTLLGLSVAFMVMAVLSTSRASIHSESPNLDEISPSCDSVARSTPASAKPLPREWRWRKNAIVFDAMFRQNAP